MNETTGSVLPDSIDQSKKHLVHENNDLDSGLKKNQGKKMDDSKNARGGRENSYKNNGKQSFANLFKDNKVPIEASLLSVVAVMTRGLIKAGQEAAKTGIGCPLLELLYLALSSGGWEDHRHQY